MRAFTGAIAAFVFLFSSSLLAEEFFMSHGSTKQLIDICRDRSDYSDGFCNGFIQGAFSLSANVENIDKTLCLPNETSYQQIKAIYIKWSENHPEDWHKSAEVSLLNSLVEAFPCKKDKK